MRELMKKELFNAKANATALKDCNETINVVAVTVTANSDGSAVGYIATDDGKYYSTTSPTVMDLLVEVVDFDDEAVAFNVIRRKSKNNREYLTLELL